MLDPSGNHRGRRSDKAQGALDGARRGGSNVYGSPLKQQNKKRPRHAEILSNLVTGASVAGGCSYQPPATRRNSTTQAYLSFVQMSAG